MVEKTYRENASQTTFTVSSEGYETHPAEEITKTKSDSSSSVIQGSLDYTIVHKMCDTENVVFVLNIGSSPKEEFIKRANAKVQKIRPLWVVSSKSV
jgi:hypothetical protein